MADALQNEAPSRRRRFRLASLAGEFAMSTVDGVASSRQFNTVERYCMFIGYPRSGHSLVGSLVAAHPDAVIAHELDVLRYIQAGFRRTQIFSLILRNERQFTNSGRRARVGDYDYAVPNQWQGRYRSIRVIGDKRGGRSTRRLADRPELLDKLRRTVGVPLRIVHVARNPFDNITTMSMRKEGGSLDRAIATYFSLCETVSVLRANLADEELIDLRHEDVVADPKQELSRLCRFLDLDPEPAYLDDCASIVFPSPRRSRERIDWAPELRREVEAQIGRFQHLAGYSFDD